MGLDLGLSLVLGLIICLGLGFQFLIFCDCFMKMILF